MPWSNFFLIYRITLIGKSLQGMETIYEKTVAHPGRLFMVDFLLFMQNQPLTLEKVNGRD